MRFLSRCKNLIAVVAGAIALMVAMVAPAAAQLNGSVGTVTLNQVAFSAQASAAVSSTFRNVGQSSHWLTYCTTNATGVQIALEGSEDNSTWFQISNLGTATGCSVLSAGGYFQYVRANLYSIAGTGATVTAYYTASSFPIQPGGLVNQGASTQKVSMIAATPYVNTALSSTAATVTSSPAIVYAVHVYNPNASAVFVNLTDNGAAAIERAIPAGGASDLSLAPGVLFSTNVEATCSANATSLTAPGTPCLVNVLYRGLTTVNSVVQSNGVVYSTHTGSTTQ